MPPSFRRCAAPNCGKSLKGKRSDANFCSLACKQRARRHRRKAVKATIEKGELPEVKATQAVIRVDGERHNISPPTKDDEMYAEGLLREGHTISSVADHMNRSKSWVWQINTRRIARDAMEADRESWSQSDEIRHLLALDLEMPTDLRDLDGAIAWANAAADRFLAFEQAYFRVAGGKLYIRKDFHREWIVEFLVAIATGGYLQIMAPPRHGKTELLRNFAVWLICRNPDIRILWVGPNETTAAETVSAVREILTHNTELIAAVLGPGGQWKGDQWASIRFTVKVRTTGLTGSTMLAVGRGGQILSKNADLIVVDDPENAESTEQPHVRRKTRRWYGQDLDSRKEEHTALCTIGSRQHPDDLYGYNLENPDYRVVVNSAHKLDCVLDPGDEEAHVDCMLFPELRSYRWLMTKQRGSDIRDDEGVFEMIYLNQAIEHGYHVFVKEIVEPRFNYGRDLGLGGIPDRGRRLIAGLDPSATGYQSAFLWAVTPTNYKVPDDIHDYRGLDLQAVQDRMLQRWMVDLENRRGGGVEEALRQFEDWRLAYGVDYWVLETNLYRGSIKKDPRVVEFCRVHDVYIETIDTQGPNKSDPRWGVGSMKRLFTNDMIDLPYGNQAARTKTQIYARQLYAFTEDALAQRKRRSDVMMAGWFPSKVIRRWEKEEIAAASREVEQLESGYPVSYPRLSGFTQHNTAPWRR